MCEKFYWRHCQYRKKFDKVCIINYGKSFNFCKDRQNGAACHIPHIKRVLLIFSDNTTTLLLSFVTLFSRKVPDLKQKMQKIWNEFTAHESN